MSMFDSIGRYGAAIKNAHDRSKARRVLNSLPAELQKDIGWPVTPRTSARDELNRLLLGSAR